MNKTKLLLLVVALIAVFGGVWLARIVFTDVLPPTLVAGTLLRPARPLPTFSLVDHNGMHFDNENLKGHWSVLFFGFTHCPGVCPTTLILLDGVAKSLSDLRVEQRPQILFISVDPKRDTPDVMREYLRHFNPAFIGVTGEQREIGAFTTALGIPTAIVPVENGDYMVEHSQSLLLVNPHGQFNAIFSAPHDPKKLAADYRRIVQ